MQVTTKTQIQPYLFFEGRCEEALEFYKTVAGAQVEMLMRYSQSPEPCAEGMTVDPEKVMHASFRIGEATVMASDGMCTGQSNFHGFGLALSLPEAAQAERIFQGLSQGGQVVQPLQKTFFSPLFGMVHDKFGVHWMVMVTPAS